MKNKKFTAARNFDEDAIREITLFAENCRAVYIGSTCQENIPGAPIWGAGLEAMENCITKHICKGDYTPENAAAGMKRVFDFAAKVYDRIFGGGAAFDAASRREAARRYVVDHERDWHYCAVHAFKDAMLKTTTRGLYVNSWNVAPEEATDNQLRRVLRAWDKAYRACIEEAKKRQENGENHVFIRDCWIKIRAEFSYWCNYVAYKREDNNDKPGAARARSIIAAAEKIYSL